ncbi:molybdate ABC transporter substrate-binding protein [Adhaeribacter pallidiroseus]|uniref:Molybdate-binding periplasmic protein n=1 Tax=Adhaeribacter pallidiroseus TaxID=2072847 RepID=A0A369QD20_9BACT|nr:molybdate ABC transporter substrate-binding protein [Adhaeribacter pallidiroseus]RDC62322.1 Molybdate-binding periplasmic protein [Adhaeribacter pallidiroseus]
MRLFSIFVFILAFNLSGVCQPVRVAVAANAQFVMKALQADFKKKTGMDVEIISGSSGKLMAQIKNGAPYDLFLSADMDFPENLYQAGFGISKPQVYALGSLIVCTTLDVDLKNWPELLTQTRITKMAIANPKLAPYGKAAQATLQHYKLWHQVQAKLIYGESIAQVNTYLSTGAVPVGFTSEALIYENLKKTKFNWVRVDKKLYPKIKQGVIVLSYAQKKNYAKVLKFYNYLFSPAAQQLFRQNGYQTP